MWNNRRSIVHHIWVVHTRHIGWPTQEYMEWWERSCRRRYLSVDPVLHDPWGVQLPDDVPPATTQPRDDLVLPQDAPARGRRARQQRPDVRRKGKGVASSSQSQDQPGGDDVNEEAEYRLLEDIPEGGDVHDQGAANATVHESDADFFSGADLELARWALQGDGSGPGSAPRASGFQVAEPLSDMYEVFTCSEQMMDQLAQEFVAARSADEPISRCRVFSIISHHLIRSSIHRRTSNQQYMHPSPHQQYMYPSPQPQSFHQLSPQMQYPQYMHYSPQPGFSHQIPYHTSSPHPQYHQSSTQS
ncbi:hypothetical protein PIB30_035183 [Stylosanthes scabra]|uniref:Uncharacterized protein n=1 Tax=Stylosanthes scabra TaxID=79078 RepID=A0ABU6ZCP4_9FABA|nr:hypothetical protein [Stylosanthes scabra]